MHLGRIRDQTGQRRRLRSGGVCGLDFGSRRGIFRDRACNGETKAAEALSWAGAGPLDGEVAGPSPSGCEGNKSLRTRSQGRRQGQPWDDGCVSGLMRTHWALPPPPMARFHPPPPRPYYQAHDCAAVDVSVGRDPALGLAWLGLLHLSAEGAPVVLPPLPPPRGLSLRLTRSSADPALTQAPPLTACLAPWTGSQTSRACSRSYSCSKTRSRPTQPHSVSCRMYPSFLPGLQAGENGDHPLIPRLFLQCLGAGLGRELRIRI